MILNKFIDHTLLKPDATKSQIATLCQEALLHDFFAVCVNPYWVPLAAALVNNSSVKVCTVVGFPLGANKTEIKVAETKQAVADGADEIDMVLNIGALKNRDINFVKKEIAAVVSAAEGRPVKVILETCLFSQSEKETACRLCLEAGASYVKTSTGFSKDGATLDDVRLMRRIVGDRCGVKASGGIRDRSTALAMIEAGASRLGTSSGVVIVTLPAV